MLSIRGGGGLGDAIYVQSVVRHLVEQGKRLEVCTGWPDVFRPLDGKVQCVPFRRKNTDLVAHYTTRRGAIGTSQFDDCRITAGVHERIEMRLDWTPQNKTILSRIWNPRGLPIIVVQMPRPPFGRTDGFGIELLPDCRRIQDMIGHIRRRALFVQVGAGESLFKFDGIDLDLSNRTSVSELIDVGHAADAFIGQCSFIIPLAESFAKPVLLAWSRKGLNSHHEVIRQMTPKKILHRSTSYAVMDDCPDFELMAAADALLEQVGNRVAV